MSSDEELDWSEPEFEAKRFRVTSTAKIAESLQELVANLGRELSISQPLAQLLLYRNKFNFDRCVEAYFDNPDALGVPDFDDVMFCSGPLAECLMCCEEDVRGVDIGCGHSICRDCFVQYTNMQVDDRNLEIRCPGDTQCRFLLTDDIIKTVVSVHTWRKYLKTKVELWLPVARRRFTGCPTPDCRYYIELLEPIDTRNKMPGIALQDAVVECGCAATFCFLCSQSHLPVSCEMMESWSVASNDASNVWIREHTKQCPNCGTNIQKNAGCAHMSCRCGYHFCWECLGHFPNYNHRCAKFNDGVGSEVSKSTVESARLMHYAPRVEGNLGRAKFHFTHLNDLLDKYRDKDEDPLDEFSAIKADDHRIEVHTALAHGRSLLAWTLVLLHYIKSNNSRLMLEDCVINLQEASENLGREITAKTIKITPEEQLRRASYVRTRTSTLLKFVISNRWEFEEFAKI